MIQLWIMRPATCLLLFLLLLCSSCVAAIPSNQISPPGPKAMPRISAAEAESRLMKKVDPVYSQMARLAHVQGEVVLNIVVSSEGKVVDVRELGGHPILIQAAIDAVNQWQYKPYLVHGEPQAVATIVHVKFTFPGDPQAIQYPEGDYYLQERLCEGLLDEKAFDEAESACALLPGLSEKLNTHDSQKGRENAYRYAGLAHYKVSKYQDAATAWQHQLAIVKDRATPNDPDLGWVYSNVALALAGTGDVVGARANWEQAKNILEAAHKQSPDDDDVSDRLRRVLTDYAKFLRQVGDSAKAEMLEKEAESLSH